MSQILRDSDIRRILGTIIKDGDESSIRPNSYILRLGSEGEFLSVGKDFKLGQKKLGLQLQPGHSVGMTAFETIDFRKETVEKVFPGKALHALLSPTTDLAREGMVTPTGQVDSGYHGTLNWTVNNTSSEERRFVYKERLMRLTLFLLGDDEVAEKHYTGDYHEQTGYVRSKRQGPPMGMKADQWEDASVEEGPEAMLEGLIKSGYPWSSLGTRLKIIDQQMQSVTNEYADIRESLDKMAAEVTGLTRRTDDSGKEVVETIRRVVKEETEGLQNRWLIGAASLIAIIGGAAGSIFASTEAMKFLQHYGALLGLALIFCGGLALFLLTRRRR